MTKETATEKRVRPLQIKFYVTEDERKKIVKKAQHCQSLSHYLRKMTLNGKVNLPAPAIDRETQMQLARLGSNINQIIHALHKAEMNILTKSIRNRLIKNVEELKVVLDENRKKLYQILDEI